MKPGLFLLLMLLMQVAPSVATSQTDRHPKLDLDLQIAPQSTRQNRDRLVGTWYRRQQTAQGGIDSEITILRNDGTYLFRFRRTEKHGLVTRYRETGLWGISADIHFTIKTGSYDEDGFQRAEPSNFENYIAYRVLELANDVFTYQTITTGNVFTARRVDEGFDFPDELAASNGVQSLNLRAGIEF